MKHILKTLTILILVVFTNTTFSADNYTKDSWSWIIQKEDWTKTIKELKQEVKTIDEQKEESDKQLDELKKELLVKKFFKVNLNYTEKNKLNKLIRDYKKRKQELNNAIIIKSRGLKDTVEIKKKLLLNEKDLYWDLIEYIDINKYDEYIQYIKKNIIIVNRKSNLDSSSAQKEVIIQEKVDNIKEKIQEHNKITTDNTIILLNTKISKILLKLTKKEKFKNLNKNWKIKLFDNLISVIDKKLDVLKKKPNLSKTQEIIIENKNKILENIKIFKANILK